MTRRFLFVSHTVPPTGDWGLDDLAGGAGRVDVLCRAIQSTLFLSHDLRADTECILAFVADPNAPTAIRMEGGKVNRLNPDERSTAARIRNALRARHDDPWWEEAETGIHVAPFTLAELADELDGTPVVLHKDGTDLESADLPADPLFILGDHQPLSDDELAPFAGGERISLGPVWYHGNHVASVVQYTLDRRGL